MNATSYWINKESESYFNIPFASIMFMNVISKTSETCEDKNFNDFVRDTEKRDISIYEEWCKLHNRKYQEPIVSIQNQYELHIILTNGMELLFVTDDLNVVNEIKNQKNLIIPYGI